MRPVKLILIKNYNFSSNLKIGHVGPKQFIDYNNERISDGKLRFTEIKWWHFYTKKMRPAGSILGELQGDSVVWKIAQKSHFITLS